MAGNAAEQTGKPWYTVVERAAVTDGADMGEEIPPYVFGPLTKEVMDFEMGNSEVSITYALLTIDAKNERYVAHGCYATQDPPAGERILPHDGYPEDREATADTHPLRIVQYGIRKED